MAAKIEKIKETFQKLNPVSKKCLKFGIFLSFFMVLASILCRILAVQMGEVWKYWDMSLDLATGALDCMAAIVITALFWDVVIKLGKYED